eukprot:TRINITY_DN26247_c0_g1_i3.p1 TRINITY_DN26247_c0_g1~~TRINITY_DN26247_c0_g1_i3.p1  ORF type:complete len:981 (+),score=222.95 TRINITY_DN26247_c0_g1_i3:86-3028(+)
MTESAQPPVQPAAPVQLSGSFFFGKIGWSYPDMRGADITGMQVQMYTSDAWEVVGNYPPHVTEHEQHDLEPGKPYLVRVVANSKVGPSVPSGALTLLTRTASMPAKAYPPICVAGKTSLTSAVLQFGPTLMADYDGPPISRWELQQRDKHFLNWTTVLTDGFKNLKTFSPNGFLDHHFHHPDGRSSNQFVAKDLNPGQEYQFRVRAQNADGFGDWSEPTSVVTLSAAPAQPPALKVVGTPTFNSLTVQLSEPETFGAAVRGYTLQRRTTRAWYATQESGEVKDVSGWYSVCELPPNVTTVPMVEDLEAGASHAFRYMAFSNAGDSPWSETLDIVLPIPEPPEAPRIMSCGVDETGAVEIVWHTPKERGAMVTGYELWASDSSCGEWSKIYTGFTNGFVDEHHRATPHTVRGYRVRALTDETPPSGFSKVSECDLFERYTGKIPVLVKGHLGPKHQKLLWVSRDEPVHSLRYKVPTDLYPTGKIRGFAEDRQDVQLTLNGSPLSEHHVPVPYSIVISSEPGHASYIQGHEVVVARDVSFAQVYARMLRYFDPMLRDKQEAVSVVADPTATATIVGEGNGWPHQTGGFIELGDARVSFSKCAHVNGADGSSSVPLPSKDEAASAHLPLYDLAALREQSGAMLSPLLEHGTALVPMYQREALCIDMSSRAPVALKVGYGDSNVLTGQPDVPGRLIRTSKSCNWPPTPQQNYMVLPEQRWLANRNATGDGAGHQFVPVALSETSLNAAQRSGVASQHQVTVTAYPELPSDAEVYVSSELSENTEIDLFSTASEAGLCPGDCVFLRSKSLPGVHSPTLADLGIGANTVLAVEFTGVHKDSYQLSHQTSPQRQVGVCEASEEAPAALSMMGGLAVGGRMSEAIYPDLMLGPRRWDTDVEATATVHLVNSMVFTESTGLPMPAGQMCEEDYKKLGLPRSWRSEWSDEMDADGIFSKERSELTASSRAESTSHGALLNFELLKSCNTK